VIFLFVLKSYLVICQAIVFVCFCCINLEEEKIKKEIKAKLKFQSYQIVLERKYSISFQLFIIAA
jgi:hypothetical protein